MACVESGGWNWDAISAVATAIGTGIALVFSALALWAPAREAERQRRESTLEILRAAEEAFTTFNEAAKVVRIGPWSDAALGKAQARAVHGKAALEQLIQRPSLTDGAIYTGAGAIALLGTILGIEHQRDAMTRALLNARARNEGGAVRIDAGLPAKRLLESGDEIMEVTKERAERVRQHLEETWLDRKRRHAKRSPKVTRN